MNFQCAAVGKPEHIWANEPHLHVKICPELNLQQYRPFRDKMKVILDFLVVITWLGGEGLDYVII